MQTNTWRCLFEVSGRCPDLIILVMGGQIVIRMSGGHRSQEQHQKTTCRPNLTIRDCLWKGLEQTSTGTCIFGLKAGGAACARSIALLCSKREDMVKAQWSSSPQGESVTLSITISPR